MKAGDVVICPSIVDDFSLSYLTPKKEYEVIRVHDNNAFVIIDDTDEEIVCNENDCAHLVDGNWILK